MRRRSVGVALLGFIAAAGLSPVAEAADPIRIGLSMAQTGPLAANGKSALLAIDI
jgi:branched-chain amino acid transport system substrate-binding protein